MSTNTSSTPNPSPDSCADGVLLRVKHETVYRYPGPASLAYNAAWLEPLSGDGQMRIEHRLKVDPKPQFQNLRTDAFGNQMHYFEVHKPHSALKVVSEAIVERRPRPHNGACAAPWERARYAAASDPAERAALCSFAYPDASIPIIDEVIDYTLVSFQKGRALNEAVKDFAARIYRDFKYTSGATQVDTSVTEFWELRKGVCQDFANLAVLGLRAIGLAAAYVSGYVLTHPPEGEKKRQGADASHAWFAVHAPGYGWIHVDPTNNMWVAKEHIIVAIGRNYTDVPPLKGVCYGGGQQQPEVAVTVDIIKREDLFHGHSMERL